MKLCYIIHPYRGKTPEEVKLNIQAACCVGLAVARKGYYPVIPQSNTAEFDLLDPTIEDAFWLAGSLELLQRCDVAVYSGDYQRSSGCMGELQDGGPEGMCFYALDELPDLPKQEID